MTKTRGKKSRSETKRILPPRSSASSSSSSEEREKERELGLMRFLDVCFCDDETMSKKPA